MTTETAIQTAINSLLAIDSLRVAGVFPEDTFDAILYGAAAMPTESEILTARDALKTMANLQVNGNFPEIVELALLKLIAEGGGGGSGAVESVNGQTGVVNLTAANVGAEPAFATLSDTKLGDRTASDATAPTNLGPGNLTTWLGWIANRIRAITGGASWFAAPATTLATTATHIANTSNPHSVTSGQIFSASQTANNFFGAPNGSAGAPTFRALASADIPLATSTLKGAISKETSGVFTPTLEGSTTAGAHTYGTRTGSYYLVGNICVASLYMVVTTKDAAMAGNVQISGLPFTSAAFLQSASIAQYAQVTLTAGNTQVMARVESSNTRLLLFQSGSGIGATVLQAGAIASNFVLIATVAYVITP